MIKFVYISLKLLELFIFFLYGKKISKTKTHKEYWRLAIIPILTYAIVEGLRFGRQIDWNLYYFRYKNIGNNLNFYGDDYEFLFTHICHFLYQIGIPYSGFIFLQCLFLMSCIFVLIEDFKSKSKWIIPLILVCIGGNEMFIRWYISISFFLLSFDSLIKEKWFLTFFWFVCAFYCHSGIIVFIVILIFFKLINKYAVPPRIGVILLFLSCFILSLKDIMFLADVSSFISILGGDGLSRESYLNETEELLSGTWGTGYVMQTSFLSCIRIFFTFFPIIYWGQKSISEYKYGRLIYNIFVIGVITMPLFGLIEIFNRISGFLTFFYCIVGGLYYYSVFNKIYNVKNKFMIIFTIISFIFAFWPFFNDFTMRDELRMMFIWDANGRNFLKYW